MPILNFPTDPDGFALEVLVALEEAELTSLQNAGQPVPTMLKLRAIVNSGCDVTGVATAVIQHFGIPSIGNRSSTSASGTYQVNLCRVMLVIPDSAGVMGPSPLIFSTLRVIELVQPLTKIDVLIGRDVLHECLFVADGPGKRFSLAF